MNQTGLALEPLSIFIVEEANEGSFLLFHPGGSSWIHRKERWLQIALAKRKEGLSQGPCMIECA